MTYWGTAFRFWGVAEGPKVSKRLAFRVQKTALKIAPTFNKRQSTHECIATHTTHMWGAAKR